MSADQGPPRGRGGRRVTLVLPEWLEAGFLGGFAVAIVFAARDVSIGQPFHTPSVLGTLLFDGLEAARRVHSAPGAAAAYNVVHFVFWIALALITAQLLRRAEDDRALWWLPMAALAVALVGLIGIDLLIGETALGAAHLWLGGVAGIAAMGGFLLWRHPGARPR